MKISIIPEHTGERDDYRRLATYHERYDRHADEVVVTLSPEQAVELIRTLWRLLPLELRPVP